MIKIFPQAPIAMRDEEHPVESKGYGVLNLFGMICSEHHLIHKRSGGRKRQLHDDVASIAATRV